MGSRHTPGTTSLTIYRNGRQKGNRYLANSNDNVDLVNAEYRAIEKAREIWNKDSQTSEVTIVRYDDTSCEAIRHYFPASSYQADHLISVLHGQYISYRRRTADGLEVGEGTHHLTHAGEQRYLDHRFGPTDCILAFNRRTSDWIERRIDADGVITILGRGVCVLRYEAAQGMDTTDLPTHEEAVALSLAVTNTIWSYPGSPGNGTFVSPLG